MMHEHNQLHKHTMAQSVILWFSLNFCLPFYQ